MAASHGIAAIAVMDVEIDDGDLFKAKRLRMQGADKNIVEEAKAHGLPRFCMVAGRADGAEGPLRFARYDIFHRMTDCAGGMNSSIPGAGGKDSVAIERDIAAIRQGILQCINIIHGMGAGDPADLSLTGRDKRPFFFIKQVKQGLQPGRAFGMAGPGIMAEAR